MYTWGRNIDGQLGHSGRKEAAIPTLVPDIRAAQIACGADYTLALHADGQVLGWGSNATAQVSSNKLYNICTCLDFFFLADYLVQIMQISNFSADWEDASKRTKQRIRGENNYVKYF